MKKIAVLFFALCALAAPAAVADDNDWIYIGATADGSDYYISRSSAKDQGSYVTGWVKHMIDSTTAAGMRYTYGRTPSYQMEMWGVNKNASRKQIRVFQIVLYDKNDNVITVGTPDSDPYMRQYDHWMDCPPGSMVEEIWTALNYAAELNQRIDQILREFGIE